MEKNEAKFKGALFDLDGVLIDTESKYTEFWDKVARKYGKQPTFAYDIKGVTLSNILDAHFPKEDHEMLEKAVHEHEDRMEFMLFPGVWDFLKELKKKNIPMAIVTSSDDKKMNSLKKQHPELVEMMTFLVDGSMVKNSKPHPEGYMLAAEMLGLKSEECIVFEDSMQGLEAGNRAGAKVVGLATTNPVEKVKPLSDVVLESWIGVTPEKLGF